MTFRPLLVLSLPRSGSTLLERILRCVDGVAAATSEPTVIAPWLFALRSQDYVEGFHYYTVLALKEFAELRPGGIPAFKAALRRHIYELYEPFCRENTRYFLDKTPMYSLLSEELVDLLPDARFIVLLRNPFQIAASLCRSFEKSRWRMRKWEPYFQQALPSLIRISGRPNVLTVHYEELVMKPESELQRVCGWLGLPYSPDVVKNFGSAAVQGSVRDPNASDSAFASVRQDRVGYWDSVVENALRKAWCRRVILSLPQDVLAASGVNPADARAQLDRCGTFSRSLASDLPYWLEDTVRDARRRAGLHAGRLFGMK